MEDFKDNLPTEGKRYYLSHSEYFLREEYLKKMELPLSFMDDKITLTQLVCATNQEKAREAVLRQLEGNGVYMVTQCRIDNLVVGE